MKDKVWTPNPNETGEGILKIIEDLDMIESYKTVPAKGQDA